MTNVIDCRSNTLISLMNPRRTHKIFHNSWPKSKRIINAKYSKKFEARKKRL